MIIAVVDHDWRHQFPEDIKALVVKIKKEKLVIEKEKYTIMASTKKDKGKKHSKHRNSTSYSKKSCYNLMLVSQRRLDWELYDSKKYLL